MSFYRRNLNNQIGPEEKQKLLTKNFILKNTVFISNIPKDIFLKEILYQKKFLGQYGHINQLLLLNNNKIENSVIVQFDTINQAALCIISLENFEMNEKQKLKTNYYNTKYCHYFLNNKECKNTNCLFIHSFKINDYLYKEIFSGEYINSFQFALKVLDVSLNSFNLIYEKFIGEKFFEKKGKFPKLTMKKLKREEYNKNLDDNNLIKKKKKNHQKSIIKILNNYNINNNINKNNENELKNNNDYFNKKNIKDSTFYNQNFYIDKLKKRELKHSRFIFENKKEKDKDKVYIPESVVNTVDKIIEIYMNSKINKEKTNNEKCLTINNVNIKNFNINLSDMIYHIFYGIMNHKF